MRMFELFPRASAGYCRSLLLLTLVVCCCPQVRAQGFFGRGAVGGISIDADGVLREPAVEATQQLRRAMHDELQVVPTELGPMNLRKISLRQLEAALQQVPDRDLRKVPDEIRYLAGIQRLRYVLIYPEQQDIVLAGPGEGWVVNEQGAVVGQTTGRPVLKLEDLLVALQTVRAARETGISCSIDPTEEGVRAMREYVARQKSFAPAVLDGMAQSLGPQRITIAGVPDTSHLARVLVAADYRMKRIGMQLEESPLPELPSFLQMLSESRVKLTNMMPRWWLACSYEPLARSDDGLAWELRGSGVKVMTEDDYVSDQGQVAVTGKQNPVAARWAELMTQYYDALSAKDSIFGQLRNVMDLCVVAALIDQEQLLTRAGCELPCLTGVSGEFQMESWPAPKTVSTQCSVIKRGRDYLITASGGVQIDAYRHAARSEVSADVGQVRDKTKPAANRWWWN